MEGEKEERRDGIEDMNGGIKGRGMKDGTCVERKGGWNMERREGERRLGRSEGERRGGREREGKREREGEREGGITEGG